MDLIYQVLIIEWKYNMKYFILIIFYIFNSISFSKEITIDTFFVTDAIESKVMEFGDILTYRQTSGTATWNDSEGDYGVLSVWVIT